jgi:hypothetical protein
VKSTKERPRPGPAAAKRAALEDRLTALEGLIEQLLRALVRGRLMPGERRAIQKYLDGRRKRPADPKARPDLPACPACRGPLADLTVTRCPWCSVLLSEILHARPAIRRR